MKINKTKIVVFRLTEKEINLLDLHATKHEQSRSEFVRTHFINLLNTYSNEKTNNKD
jgi:metal-responsive CopG/Arc/MetJ family transcriptional regulator